MRRNHHDAKSQGFKLSYTGFFIFAALVLGGGTQPALREDFILTVMALPFIYQFFTSFPRDNTLRAYTIFCALIVAFPVLQAFFNLIFGATAPLASLDPEKSLASAIILLVAVSFFQRVLTLGSREQEGLLAYFFAGVFFNFIPSFLQFGSRSFIKAVQPFSYDIHAGFMANENHLSLLFVLAVPVLVVQFRKNRFPLLAIPVILLLMLFQLVVGSRAGILMVAAAAIASYVFIIAKSRWIPAVASLSAIAIGAYVLFATDFAALTVYENENLGRLPFTLNTLQAIKDHLPFGTGIGTFTLVYPQYGVKTGVFDAYVNHVHNDYLELFLEGGVIAAAFLILFFLVIVFGVFNGRQKLTDLQKGTLMGIIFALLHSSVDYPLRTLAISIVFAAFSGMFLTSPGSKQARVRKV